jgi:hypothetical protein
MRTPMMDVYRWASGCSITTTAAAEMYLLSRRPPAFQLCKLVSCNFFFPAWYNGLGNLRISRWCRPQTRTLPSSSSRSRSYNNINNTLSPHPHIISRETARDAINLPIPPIINTLRLLHNPDTIALPESQIAVCLPLEIVQSSNILRLRQAPEAFGGDWRRRLLLFGCDAGGTD